MLRISRMDGGNRFGLERTLPILGTASIHEKHRNNKKPHYAASWINHIKFDSRLTVEFFRKHVDRYRLFLVWTV